MLLLLVTLLNSLFCLSTFAFPSASRGLHRRNDNSSSSKISATILAPNGTDISSSFRTMIYRPPTNMTSQEDSVKLGPRGTITYSYVGRPISGDGMCRSATAEFHHSICKSSLGIPGTAQDFLVYCQETGQQSTQVPLPTSRASRVRHSQLPQAAQPSTSNRGGPASTSYDRHGPPILAEHGSCWEDEICIDGIFTQRGYPELASCVLQEDYDQEFEEDDSEVDLEGRLAQITVTALDGRAPVKMRKLEIEAAKRDYRYGASSSLETIKECSGCYRLNTDSFAPNTDSLKMEASVMTAGAMAGILWVALSAG